MRKRANMAAAVKKKAARAGVYAGAGSDYRAI